MYVFLFYVFTFIITHKHAAVKKNVYAFDLVKLHALNKSEICFLNYYFFTLLLIQLLSENRNRLTLHMIYRLWA